MKRFLRYSALIFTLGLLVNSLIALAFEQLFLSQTQSHLGYKLERFYNFEDDIFFLGSSRAQQSFMLDTIFSEGKAYNYGMDGTGNWLWRHQIEDLITNEKPELIFINVDPPSLDILPDLNATYFINIPHDSRLFSSISPEIRRSIGYFPFKYFGTYIELFRSGIKEWINITAYRDKGSHISVKSNLPGMFYARSFRKDTALTAGNDEIRELRRILESNAQDQVVFLKIPSYNEQNDTLFFSQFEPAFTDIPRITFMDHSAIMQDSSLWYDHAHFNIQGAAVYSKYLREALRESIRRGDLTLPEGAAVVSEEVSLN